VRAALASLPRQSACAVSLLRDKSPLGTDELKLRLIDTTGFTCRRASRNRCV